MSINGLGNIQGITKYKEYTPVPLKMKEKEDISQKKEDVAAIYEKSSDEGSVKKSYTVSKMSKEERSALVESLQQEQQKNQDNLMNLVKEMMLGQGKAYNDANDVWKFLASGDYTVTEAAKEEAKKAISEDGYYGVKQTSERLFEFAQALAGDDTDTMKKMQDAMMKGFEEATKTWGKELPSICQETIDAANKMFDDYYASKEEA